MHEINSVIVCIATRLGMRRCRQWSAHLDHSHSHHLLQVCMATPLGVLVGLLVPRAVNVHTTDEGIYGIDMLLVIYGLVAMGGAVGGLVLMRIATHLLCEAAEIAPRQIVLPRRPTDGSGSASVLSRPASVAARSQQAGQVVMELPQPVLPSSQSQQGLCAEQSSLQPASQRSAAQRTVVSSGSAQQLTPVALQTQQVLRIAGGPKSAAARLQQTAQPIQCPQKPPASLQQCAHIPAQLWADDLDHGKGGRTVHVVPSGGRSVLSLPDTERSSAHGSDSDSGSVSVDGDSELGVSSDVGHTGYLAQTDVLPQILRMARNTEYVVTALTFAFMLAPMLLLIGQQVLVISHHRVGDTLCDGMNVLAVGVVGAVPAPLLCMKFVMLCRLSATADCLSLCACVHASSRAPVRALDSFICRALSTCTFAWLHPADHVLRFTV